MLMSFSSAMFRPFAGALLTAVPGRGLGLLVGLRGGSVGLRASGGGAVWPLDARADGGWRFWLFGMA